MFDFEQPQAKPTEEDPQDFRPLPTREPQVYPSDQRKQQLTDPLKETELPPHSPEAEDCALGCVFSSWECLTELTDQLKGDPLAFYLLPNRTTFQTLLAMKEEGIPIEFTTLWQRLKDTGLCEAVGGISRLMALPDKIPSAANLPHYTAIILEKYALRRVQKVAVDVAAAVRSTNGLQKSEHLMDEVEQVVKEAKALAAPVVERSLKSILQTNLDLVEWHHANQGKLKGLPTGFKDLDWKLLGMNPAEMIVLAARPSVGKAQPVNSLVMTPSGWRVIGSLVEGDFVTGQDGKPKRVNKVFPQGQLETFKVTMTDGGSTQCCADHLWNVNSRVDRKKNNPVMRGVLRVKKTSDMMRDVWIGRCNYGIQWVAPVEIESRGDLLIDPWLLGMWLGDGSCPLIGSAMIHNPELDIIARIQAVVPIGDMATPHHDSGRTCPVVRIKKNSTWRAKTQFVHALEKFELRGTYSDTKFIPEPYLYSSVESRIKLLQGLADSDGFVNHQGRHLEFCTASERMKDGVVFLVGSLGGRVTWVKRKTHYLKNGKRTQCMDSFRMQISFANGIVPVSSQKHLKRWRTGERTDWRYIESIKPSGISECVCISVDENLYVTDNFIVTHNTGLMMGICEHIAIIERHPVGIISLEMTAESLMLRSLCSIARVNIRDIRNGDLTEEMFTKIAMANKQLRLAPFYICDDGGMSIVQLKSKARRMKEEHGIKFLGIDYLQLINGGRHYGSREQEVAAISSGIKSLAKELEIPIMVLSQLNRDLEKRKGKPMLSDLRESGAIEADADTVLLLSKEPQNNDDNPMCQPMIMDVSKQRNGETGEVRLLFLKNITRFESAGRVSSEDVP